MSYWMEMDEFIDIVAQAWWNGETEIVVKWTPGTGNLLCASVPEGMEITDIKWMARLLYTRQVSIFSVRYA